MTGRVNIRENLSYKLKFSVVNIQGYSKVRVGD